MLQEEVFCMNFKSGLYHLSDNANYNFQLNRLINWDGGDLEEVKSISHRIKTNADWKKELIRLGDGAFQEERWQHAIAYYRMSEFFISQKDPDKLVYYKKAKELFYDFFSAYFSSGQVKKAQLPYEDVYLPVLYTKSKIMRKGTIVFHGGNDSYLEELFFPMLYFAENGYDVYLFEGPGQGSVLREQGKTFTHQWEKPVRTLLDHFDLNDVIIIGVSLGGMLAPRAAAFEKRIKYVVAWSVFPDFLQIALRNLPKIVRAFLLFLLKCRQKRLINCIANRKIKKDVFLQWAFEHGMYAYGAKSPYEYLSRLHDFQMLNIAERIDQDILILHGKEDHFISWKLYKIELDSLLNAKSITFRLFTSKENASDHCQCGNTKLALDSILCWLDSIREDER